MSNNLLVLEEWSFRMFKYTVCPYKCMKTIKWWHLFGLRHYNSYSRLDKVSLLIHFKTCQTFFFPQGSENKNWERRHKERVAGQPEQPDWVILYTMSPAFQVPGQHQAPVSGLSALHLQVLHALQQEGARLDMRFLSHGQVGHGKVREQKRFCLSWMHRKVPLSTRYLH